MTYNAVDGLALLTYLGFDDLNEEETAAFVEEWDERYEKTERDILRTTWGLYSQVLPDIGRTKNEANVLSIERERLISTAIDLTDTYGKFRSGMTLDEIISQK